MTGALPTYTTQGATAFWRQFACTIAGPAGTAARFNNIDTPGSSVRMAFNIERNFSGPGPRNLVLYNLSTRTRSLLKKGSRLTIEAGYTQALGTICIGSVMKVKTERQGPDVLTTMELIDSESFSRMCLISKTYAPATKPGSATSTGGVDLITVLADITAAMQLTYDPKAPIAIQGGVAVGIRNPRYTAGLVLNHTCGDALDILLKPQNLQWTISNGSLDIVPLAACNPTPVLLLNKRTGLINTPSLNEREHVLFQTLMNHKLQPNCVVQIALPQPVLDQQVKASAKGFFKVIKTVHRGDTHGAAWDVSCEAEAYEGGFNLLRVATGNKFAAAVVP